MDTPCSLDGATLRDYATEAIRYWEPRRLFYNLLLVVVVAMTFWLNLPSSKEAITIDSVLWLFLLAVVTKRCVLRGVCRGCVRPSARVSPTVASAAVATVCTRKRVCCRSDPLRFDGIVCSGGGRLQISGDMDTANIIP